jgi:hypothetical protein
MTVVTVDLLNLWIATQISCTIYKIHTRYNFIFSWIECANEFHCVSAPNLKGRPRRKRKKRSLSPGGSESNESEESSLSTVSSTIKVTFIVTVLYFSGQECDGVLQIMDSNILFNSFNYRWYYTYSMQLLCIYKFTHTNYCCAVVGVSKLIYMLIIESWNQAVKVLFRYVWLAL